MYRTGMTEDAYVALKNAGATDELLGVLAEKIDNYPKKYAVDAFDGIQCLGINLSFLKDNKKCETLIMTLDEANACDFIAGTIPAKKSKIIQFPFT